MNDLSDRLTHITNEFEFVSNKLDVAAKQTELTQLEAASQSADFWQDEGEARKIMQQISSLRTVIEDNSTFKQSLASAKELLSLAEDTDTDTLQEIEAEVLRLEKLLKKHQTIAYLSGKYDSSDAILSIFAGQGGTEAMDWASMLMRMYMRYFEQKGFDFELVDQSVGEEAGIKAVTFIIRGRFAYGYLKYETGTHRLVRLSPFNADSLRQTSFAGVEVIPSVEDEEGSVEVKDEDLEWQFFRSGGAGGQNVNKVNTAVRVRHLPTGIVVASQSSRTQEQNRKFALQILESKLQQLKDDEFDKTQKGLKGEYKVAGWGNQIRSYVLHPYQLVKDTRTGMETSNAQAVLGGDLDMFIEAAIAKL